MTPAPRPLSSSTRQRGFSLLEMIIVVIAIALLFTVAVNRLLQHRLEAEIVSIEMMLGTLRSAMSIEIARRITRGDVTVLEEASGANPMNYLAETPYNYIGELDNPDPASIEPRQWYFDTSSGLLVYRVLHENYFDSPLPGPARARFRVRLVYLDRNDNGDFEANIDQIQGLRLVANEPYRWKSAP
jgi:prepilin-type N-terminal cleavage/methylation domain-containing protein